MLNQNVFGASGYETEAVRGDSRVEKGILSCMIEFVVTTLNMAT